MRMDHTLQVPASLSRLPFQPLMYNNVVKNEIEYPVGKNSEADGKHVRIEFHLREIVEEGDRGDAEDDGKQVVLFELVVMYCMMRLMPSPKHAVHDILMREPRNTFP